jgi:hypothetical protein
MHGRRLSIKSLALKTWARLSIYRYDLEPNYQAKGMDTPVKLRMKLTYGQLRVPFDGRLKVNEVNERVSLSPQLIGDHRRHRRYG